MLEVSSMKTSLNYRDAEDLQAHANDPQMKSI